MNSIDVSPIRPYGRHYSNNTRANQRLARRLVAWIPLQVLVLVLSSEVVASEPPGPAPCPGPMAFDGPAPASMPWKDTTLSADARATALVAAMTLNEKIDLV
ncbi:MAG: hypothetical protein JWO52_4331, partial [Gammaproteobacteria bacterium]|nr:hypothetical protein [Gammaproteobacteria bacterium]